MYIRPENLKSDNRNVWDRGMFIRGFEKSRCKRTKEDMGREIPKINDTLGYRHGASIVTRAHGGEDYTTN